MYIGVLRTHFGVPGHTLGRSFCSFVSPLENFVVSLGSLGTHIGTPGAPLGRLGDASGQHWRFGLHRRPLRKPMALKYCACAPKLVRWNSHPNLRGDGGVVHKLQFRAYLPHAPGIRMT